MEKNEGRKKRGKEGRKVGGSERRMERRKEGLRIDVMKGEDNMVL